MPEYRPVKKNCDSCELAISNPEVLEHCSIGLTVNNGVGYCGSEHDLKYQCRDGASIRTASPAGGVIIRYDKEGFLTRGAFPYEPTVKEKLLAKIGINTTLVSNDRP